MKASTLNFTPPINPLSLLLDFFESKTPKKSSVDSLTLLQGKGVRISGSRTSRKTYKLALSRHTGFPVPLATLVWNALPSAENNVYGSGELNHPVGKREALTTAECDERSLGGGSGRLGIPVILSDLLGVSKLYY
jgi:hypothetical protein